MEKPWLGSWLYPEAWRFPWLAHKPAWNIWNCEFSCFLLPLDIFPAIPKQFLGSSESSRKYFRVCGILTWQSFEIPLDLELRRNQSLRSWSFEDSSQQSWIEPKFNPTQGKKKNSGAGSARAALLRHHEQQNRLLMALYWLKREGVEFI